MSTPVPQIGFDRFIHLDWVTAALDVRAGRSAEGHLDEVLDAAGLGIAAKHNTRGVLSRLWLQPRPELQDLAARGLAIYKRAPEESVVALSWGMAIASYPFFGKVAELFGRLSAIQGGCSAAEIHRRMSEVYGERDATRRAASRVLQTQESWGTLIRSERGKRLTRMRPMTVHDDQAVAWLIEAALRYSGKAVSVASLPALAVIYPFVLDRPLGYVASNSPMLELRSEGSGHQSVTLAGAI